jgi:chromate transporter
MSRCLALFLYMFKTGAVTFGGGLAMLPQMKRDFSERLGWVSEEDILDIFAAAQALPGVIVVNASVLTGYRVAKLRGALCAAAGVILPSLLVLMAVTLVYDAFINNALVAGAMRGLRAGVAALLLGAAFSMRGALRVRPIVSVPLAVAACALCLFTSLNIIFVILGAAALGLALSAVK